jgi:hypothetical protein
MTPDKEKQRVQIFMFVVEILLLIVAFKFVSERNPKLATANGAKAIIAALCCTPCYVGYALAYPIKNARM